MSPSQRSTAGRAGKEDEKEVERWRRKRSLGGVRDSFLNSELFEFLSPLLGKAL